MKVFKAKWPGTCLCGERFEKDDDVHFVKDKVCHAECEEHNLGDLAYFGTGSDVSSVRTETYTVRGLREHAKRCPECLIEHAGKPGIDCP